MVCFGYNGPFFFLRWNVAVQKIRQFPRHVDAAAQKIGPLPTAAILREARHLRVQAEIGRDHRSKRMPRQPAKAWDEVEGTKEADAARVPGRPG